MQFAQERHVELVAGANEAFVITSRVLSAALPEELPHLSVFTVTVVDVADPKKDTLARVATLADLTTIPEGRDAGIATPGPDGRQYLSASWIATYDTLETALGAAKAFRDRVNQLVLDWQAFRADFNAPDPTPAIYTFPAVDTSQKTALIAAYKTAKQLRYLRQLEKEAADASLARAQEGLAYRQGLVTTTTAIASRTTRNLTALSDVAGFLSTLRGAGAVFHAANTSGPGAAVFETSLVIAGTQGLQAIAHVADAGELSGIADDELLSRQTEAAAAQASVTASGTDLAAKTLALGLAQTQEVTTLAAVLVVCPDFEKTSIPLVDDPG